MHVEVDMGLCQLYANCLVEAPVNFDLDDAGNLVVAEERVADENVEDVRRAALFCPVKAITLIP